MLAAIINNKLATLHELQTVYSIEDAYDLLEVLIVDNNNARVAREFYAKPGNK